jgi:hypothetical protein
VSEVDGRDDVIAVRYRVANADAAEPLTIKLYRAAKLVFSANKADDLIPLGSVVLSRDDLKETTRTQQVYIPVNTPLPLGIDGFHKYVLAVADPNHVTDRVAEVDRAYDQAGFQIHTIGVVSEGLTPGNPFNAGKNPKWVTDMTTALHNVDMFDEVIPFSWNSATAGIPAQAAGKNLYQNRVAPMVNAVRGNFETTSPHDVINFQFIGHSRGCVVISEAVTLLVRNESSLKLHHEYIKMTFLDPHPANNQYGPNASWPTTAVGSATYSAYRSIQAATKDDPVRVPFGVHEIEDFFEHTVSDKLPGKENIFLNLQGLSPSPTNVINESGVAIRPFDWTNRRVNGPGTDVIGHSEIVDWY